MREVFYALMALDALLLWVLIRTQGSWIPRALAIVLVLAMNVGVWYARPSFEGWPTAQALPAEATLLKCYVAEDEGFVYLWLLPTDKVRTRQPFDHEPTVTPRAYRLMYTPELHQSCEEARQIQQSGGEVGVGGRNDAETRLQFYLLPPILPPSKEGS